MSLFDSSKQAKRTQMGLSSVCIKEKTYANSTQQRAGSI